MIVLERNMSGTNVRPEIAMQARPGLTGLSSQIIENWVLGVLEALVVYTLFFQAGIYFEVQKDEIYFSVRHLVSTRVSLAHFMCPVTI